VTSRALRALVTDLQHSCEPFVVTLANMSGRFLGVAIASTLVLPAALLAALAFGIAAAAPTAETRAGTFVVNCPASHASYADPIVFPGGSSHHLHQFTGNRTTNAHSTYESMTAGPTTCKHADDTAGYWFPALIDPQGHVVTPERSFAYYKNLPVTGQSTAPFPPDLRMVFGPAGAFWDCFEGGGHYTTVIPNCGPSDYTFVRVKSLPCNDGRKDSPDHRSHMAPVRGGTCPPSHPIKLPQINFFVRNPPGTGGAGWKLSDGMILPHVDFWNTWQQPTLEQLVRDCLNAGRNCGQVSG
jgi:Domain of unknown function (DUF1996)